MPEKVYIAIGSNQGERLKIIESVLTILACQFKDLQASRVYETEPLYFRKQPFFLNCVASFKTMLSPAQLLKKLQQIENSFGRQRLRPFGPRALDLDILLYRNRFLKNQRLIIPHPRLTERRFILIPLIELDPYLQDPEDYQYYWKKLITAKPGLVYFYAFTGYTKKTEFNIIKL